MRRNVVACSKLNVRETASRLQQLDNCLALLNVCTDSARFPEKELRGMFFHAHDKDYQNFLKFTNEHESLTFEEVVEICEKFEINQLTDHKGNDTPAPSGERGKLA